MNRPSKAQVALNMTGEDFAMSSTLPKPGSVRYEAANAYAMKCFFSLYGRPHTEEHFATVAEMTNDVLRSGGPI